MTLNLILAIITAILFILFIWTYSTYNTLIRLRNRVKTDFSDIDVQLHRRANIIDQLVDLVKSYSTHEKDTFTGYAKARAALDSSSNAQEAAQADNMLTQTLRSLFMVTEANPKLKADKNYQMIKNDLVDSENLVANYRQEYNRSVEKLNNMLELFPSLIIGNLFSFETAEFFQPTVTNPFEHVKPAKKPAKK